MPYNQRGIKEGKALSGAKMLRIAFEIIRFSTESTRSKNSQCEWNCLKERFVNCSERSLIMEIKSLQLSFVDVPSDVIMLGFNLCAIILI
jgi:hypothetical protein